MPEPTISYKQIGSRIRIARKEKGITQSKLSELCGLSENHLSHIECGVSPLSLPALLSICHVLDCTADRLLYDNLPQPNQTYLNEDIAKCFHDATQDECTIMLSVAHAAKTSIREMKP